MRRRRLFPRIFPGERGVWLPALVLVPLFALYAAHALASQRIPLTGTNGVDPWSPVATVAAKQRACEPVRVPAHSRIIEAWAAVPAGRGRLWGALTLPGGRRLPAGPAPLIGNGTTNWPLAVASQPHDVAGQLCLWSDESITFLGGVLSPLPGERPLRIGSEPHPGQWLTLRYMSAPGTRSLFHQLLHAPQHAAVFRPGPIGPWTYWVIGLLVLPALVYSALRLLATAGWRSRRRVAVWVAATAFAFSVCWALTTPVFGGPDEPAHWSYEQYLAETGHTPEQLPGARPAYASEETLLLVADRQPTSVLLGPVRPAWMPGDERAWHAVGLHAPRDDGGGYNVASSAHSPFYYGLLTPAYEAFRGTNLVWRLTAVRILNALLASVIAAAAALTVSELLPRRPLLAAAAGLLVALEPMVAFMGGVVDNDTGVNAAAAVTIYLVVRALRRGLTPRLAVGIALGVVALPLAKIVGYGVVPAVVLGLLLAVIRLPARAILRVGGLAALTFIVATVAWTRLIAPQFTSGGQAGTLVNAGGADTGGLYAFHHPLTYLDYFVQTFVPPIHLTGQNLTYRWPAFEVYVREGFGAFGWATIQFSTRVSELICVLIFVVLALAAVAVWRARRRLREVWPAALTLLLAAVGVFAFVAAAYTSGAAVAVPGEQGRYAFPALVPLAALAALGCLGAGRRRAALVAGGLVLLMGELAVAGWFLAMAGWFT